MMRKIFFLCSLFFITTLSHAQYLGKCFKNYEIGFGYTVFKATGTQIQTNPLTQVASDTVPLSVNQPTPSAMLGFNFPIQLHKDFGFGVNTSLIASAGGAYGVQVPLFLTFKYGTDATHNDEAKRFGFGAGIGYDFTAFTVDNVSASYKIPSYFAEISFLPRNTLMKLKFISSLGSVQKNFPYDASNPFNGSYKSNIPVSLLFIIVPNF